MGEMERLDWDWLKKRVFVKPTVEHSEAFVRAVMRRIGDEAPLEHFMPPWRVWAASTAAAGLAVFLALQPTMAEALETLIPNDDVVAVVMGE